ncbi:hypothetical protein D9613_001351 [Agrocybe pediades]|uniref:Uncharacterized protein n=1 Tax=Agrocybe pediades TaxID=84607 RepID=A0A8H4R6X1_9AGAR|nr:hypothetical protein D9613_001351 [Agrocybe pediades]
MTYHPENSLQPSMKLSTTTSYYKEHLEQRRDTAPQFSQRQASRGQPTISYASFATPHPSNAYRSISSNLETRTPRYHSELLQSGTKQFEEPSKLFPENEAFQRFLSGSSSGSQTSIFSNAPALTHNAYASSHSSWTEHRRPHNYGPEISGHMSEPNQCYCRSYHYQVLIDDPFLPRGFDPTSLILFNKFPGHEGSQPIGGIRLWDCLHQTGMMDAYEPIPLYGQPIFIQISISLPVVHNVTTDTNMPTLPPPIRAGRWLFTLPVSKDRPVTKGMLAHFVAHAITGMPIPGDYKGEDLFGGSRLFGLQRMIGTHGNLWSPLWATVPDLSRLSKDVSFRS